MSLKNKAVLIVFFFCLPASAQVLKLGFAELDITPKIGEVFGLVGGGSKKIQAIEGKLSVQAAVFRDGKNQIALVSADLLHLRDSDFRYLRERIKRKGFDHVVVAATHTHGGFFSDSLYTNVRKKILQAVDQASESSQPAEMGAANINIDESYNRRIPVNGKIEMLWRNPDRKKSPAVDHTLSIIHLKTVAGAPLLTLLNYNAHPVITMDLDVPIVSADYPGYLRAAVARSIGGQAMFFLGASGDVNPYHANTKPIGKASIKASEMAETLSTAAYKAVKNISHFQKHTHFKFDTLRFEQPETDVSILMLSRNISLSGFPGEYFDELGRNFRKKSPTAISFFVSMSNGDIGYVPTSKDRAMGGYGADSGTSRVSGNTGERHIEKAVQALTKLSVDYEKPLRTP